MKRPSSSDFKRTSRLVQNATVDNTKIPRARSRPSMLPGDRVFRNERRARVAQRGEINQMLPNVTSRESSRDYAERMSRREYYERESAGRTRRRVLGAAAAVIAALIVASVVGSFTYLRSVDADLKAQDAESLSAALSADGAAAEDGAPFYTLIAADFASGESEDATRALVLARIDRASSTITLVNIPANVQATLADGSTSTMSAVRAADGDAGLVDAVENLTGVEIAHYMHTDDAGLASLIDEMGGIDADLPVMEDAGAKAAADGAGMAVARTETKHLSGQEAVSACRALDVGRDQAAQAGSIDAVAMGLFRAFADESSFGFVMKLDTVGHSLTSDMNSKDLRALHADLRGLRDATVYEATLPVSASAAEGASTLKSSSWDDMRSRIDRGQKPVLDAKDVIASVDVSSFTVTVNNGSGIEGAAAEARSVLESNGFKVESVGNASQAVYDETLVVYQNKDNAEEAAAVVAALGVGRAVYDPVYYSFSTDILAVIGKDWNPGADQAAASA